MRFLTAIGFTLVATLALGSPSRAQVNLLTNGDFEASGGSLDGWFVDDATTVGVSTAATFNIFRSGVAAAKLTGKDLTGCNGPTFQNSLIKQSFTPTSGKEYHLTGWSYMSSAEPIVGADVCAENRAVAQVAFFLGGIKLCQNEVLIAFDGFPTDTWVPFSVMLPAPSIADAVEASIIFLKPKCDVGDAVYVDDLTFFEADPTPAPTTNLIANPSFDDGFNNWTTFDNVFLVASGGGFEGAESDLVRTAERSGKMFSSFLSPPGASPSGMFQTFTATPGQTYLMEAWSMHTCADEDALVGTQNFMVAQILFRDSMGAPIDAGETVILDATSPLGTWTRHEVLATAPAGAATVQPYILFWTPANEGGSGKVDDIVLREATTSAVPNPAHPARVQLHQNVPNPFNPQTTIRLSLPAPSPYTITIHDIAGRLVRQYQGTGDVGNVSIVWDGTDGAGARVGSGLYFYKARAGVFTDTKKMVLLK